MQKILVIFLLLISGVAYAQTTTKKPAPKPATAAKKPAPPVQKPMKTKSDTFSYAIGVSIANFYKSQGIASINSSMVTKALNDCNTGKALLSEDEVNNIIMDYMQEAQREKSAAVRKEGEAFLAKNKTRPGIITTASGLQYEILKTGTGLRPGLEDRVKIHYHGTLIDGTVFESSVERGQPIEMAVNAFIQGWIEALQLMPEGSKWRLYIPSDLAYGDRDAGPSIKAGSTLIFEVELLQVLGK